MIEKRDLTREEMKNLENNELLLLHGMLHKEYKNHYTEEIWYFHSDLVEELADRRIKHFDRSLIDSVPKEKMERIIERYKDTEELVSDLFKRKKDFLMEEVDRGIPVTITKYENRIEILTKEGKDISKVLGINDEIDKIKVS